MQLSKGISRIPSTFTLQKHTEFRYLNSSLTSSNRRTQDTWRRDCRTILIDLWKWWVIRRYGTILYSIKWSLCLRTWKMLREGSWGKWWKGSKINFLRGRERRAREAWIRTYQCLRDWAKFLLILMGNIRCPKDVSWSQQLMILTNLRLFEKKWEEKRRNFQKSWKSKLDKEWLERMLLQPRLKGLFQNSLNETSNLL